MIRDIYFIGAKGVYKRNDAEQEATLCRLVNRQMQVVYDAAVEASVAGVIEVRIGEANADWLASMSLDKLRALRESVNTAVYDKERHQ